MKRCFDLFFSSLGLIILGPLLFLIALIIKCSSNGPVFFRQTRIGKHQIPFKIFKFRTMLIDAETKGPQITVGDRDPRITTIGYYLRKYKLDELPQLINVFKGDMSLVGPRPEVPRYVAMYTEEQKKVFILRPGITDFASIEFRNENAMLAGVADPEAKYIQEIMPAKLKLNLQYLQQHSLWLDIKLILKTLKVI